MKKKTLYFCTECKKRVEDLNDLLFIDNESTKGFCKKECIEDYYYDYVRYFENLENELRAKYHIEDEAIEYDGPHTVVDDVLAEPTEVYRYTNELHDSFYFFFKHFQDYSGIVMATLYQGEPSFIFFATLTRNPSLINEFKFGMPVLDYKKTLSAPIENDPRLQVDPSELEFIESLENKKSKILADVIFRRAENDISFESFPSYDYCLENTLADPDEVFEVKDNEGDMVFSYLKSFQEVGLKQGNFFYIVLCLKRNDQSENTNVYPILGMPTNDLEFCETFRKGKKLTSVMAN